MTGAEPQDPGPALSVEEARALFPGLESTTYFATNGQALLPRPTRDRLAAGVDELMARGFAAAAELETSEAAVKMAVTRLRRRFGRLLREEIAQTVEDEAEIDDEVRHLLSVVR